MLMTTPSLDPKVNVSGIASVVRGLIAISQQADRGFSWTIVPAIVGKRDSQRRRVGWLVSQAWVLTEFYCGIRHARPSIVHLNGPLSTLGILREAALIRVARFFELPIAYHLHGGAYIHEAPASLLIRWVVLSSLNAASIVIVLSDLEAKSISQVYGITPPRIRVLRNAVHVPTGCPEKAGNGRLRVLSIGRLSPEKGLSVLCDAIEGNPDLGSHLAIQVYGAGNLASEVTSRLSATLGEAFSFKGVAGEDEKATAYAWADVVVMPSLWGEGLPMVLLEAMASGVVVIATPDGSIPEVIKNGWNGILVEKSSPQSLAEALYRALEMKRNGDLFRMAKNAHLNVNNTYSLTNQVLMLEKIYADIVR